MSPTVNDLFDVIVDFRECWIKFLFNGRYCFFLQRTPEKKEKKEKWEISKTTKNKDENSTYKVLINKQFTTVVKQQN